MDDQKSFHRALRAFAVGSTLAFQFAACVVLGVLGGRYLDELWGTGPWLLLVGVLAGLAAGTLSIYRSVRWFIPQNEADKNDRS
ncbi:MAG: AtpZ/AtpI family protein [Candidatus Desulforudis sp.]|nr:AtpZ/AtpI family protein [Desulforudis sp.]